MVKVAERITTCPHCGSGEAVLEMWGWVDPETGRYFQRLFGARWDTFGIALLAFAPGVLYGGFYLIAIPAYVFWRLATWRRYTLRRFEYFCAACGFEWKVTEGEPGWAPR